MYINVNNMKVLLDINSDQRDPYKFPTPQDYTVCLNRPLYNITNIRLEAAKIPISQTLINSGNNTFSMNNTGNAITLINRNYSNANQFASNLQEQLSSPTNLPNSSVDSVTYNSNNETFTFSNTLGTQFGFDFYSGVNGYNTQELNATPATTLGFTHQNTYTTSNTLISGSVNLYPPTSIILRVTTNEHGDDLGKDVFCSNGIFNFGNSGLSSNIELNKTESVYFGRILTYDSYQGNEYLIFTGGYPIEDYFNKGPESVINKLRIRFYYTIGGKLIPYDFANKNHTLKFKITCNLDKLQALKDDQVISDEIQKELYELPPPIDLPSIEPPKRPNKQRIIVISFLLLLTGLFFLTFIKNT